MKSTRTITYALLLAAVAGVAGVASAQTTTPKTRSQVESELATAMQNGDVIGASGMTGRQLRPDLYPRPAVVGKSRAQVEAELAGAIRNGDMLAAGDLGMRERDLNPGLYPAAPVVAGKSRAQVEAELALAIRDGDMVAVGESGMTQNQLQPELYAAQRARDTAIQTAQHRGPALDGNGAQ